MAQCYSTPPPSMHPAHADRRHGKAPAMGARQGEAFVRLCHVEALHAAGRNDEARRALFEADQKLAERAAR